MAERGGHFKLTDVASRFGNFSNEDRRHRQYH